MHVGDGDARELLELLHGRNGDDLLAVVAHPQGDRGAPVAVARDGPIARVLEPVGKALLLNKLGNPTRCQIPWIKRGAIKNMWKKKRTEIDQEIGEKGHEKYKRSQRSVAISTIKCTYQRD